MDRKEAAAKWAEAKEALEAAHEELQRVSAEEYEAAKAEREAWAALEDMAGRASRDCALVGTSHQHYGGKPCPAEVLEEEPCDEVRATELVPGTQFHTQPKVRLG